MGLEHVILAAAEGGEHHSTLQVMMTTMPAGIIAAVAFFALAMVTLSYRNVANRHADKAATFTAEHGGEQQGSSH